MDNIGKAIVAGIVGVVIAILNDIDDDSSEE